MKRSTKLLRRLLHFEMFEMFIDRYQIILIQHNFFAIIQTKSILFFRPVNDGSFPG